MSGELKGGRYKVEAKIGGGGQGEVFRAYDTRLPRRVALKMVPEEVCRDPERLQRLSKEARAAASIIHPGIATVYDFEEHGEESFIVCEYVEGVTLREHLAQQGFSIDQVIAIGIQLADALCEAHDRGVVHRDLKPENLMLVSRPKGRVRLKILDFGLAKQLGPSVADSLVRYSRAESVAGSSAGLVGTVNYMAPEQLHGKGVDPRTDLFAVGLVLYELATGLNPFQGEDWPSTIANIQTREPPTMSDLNPACPRPLDEILRKCLRKSKEERYQSARDLLAAFLNLPGARPLYEEEDKRREQMPRGLARALFVLIQLGYLTMYTAALCFPSRVEQFLALFKLPHLPLIVLFSALCGAVLRLYFMAAVALDYPNTGSHFRWAFPVVLALDAVWAASPLSMFYKFGYPALLMMTGLAWLPFSARSLVSYAYSSRGGRISTARSGISVQQP